MRFDFLEWKIESTTGLFPIVFRRMTIPAEAMWACSAV
jgi:hypothetical protein